MRDVLERLRDLRPGYGNVVEDAIAEIERLRGHLEAIRKATIEGRVCDDVAWFDGITTLHDYCDMAINPSTLS